MIEAKFNAGDCVKLKSGGPAMTIARVTDGGIECSWFADGSLQHGSFTPESLKSFQGKAARKAAEIIEPD